MERCQGDKVTIMSNSHSDSHSVTHHHHSSSLHLVPTASLPESSSKYHYKRHHRNAMSLIWPSWAYDYLLLPPQRSQSRLPPLTKWLSVRCFTVSCSTMPALPCNTPKDRIGCVGTPKFKGIRTVRPRHRGLPTWHPNYGCVQVVPHWCLHASRSAGSPNITTTCTYHGILAQPSPT